MTQTEELLLDQLKATTLALRIALGHVESQYIATARALSSAQLRSAERLFRARSGTATSASVCASDSAA